jgi:hypothetical protein
LGLDGFTAIPYRATGLEPPTNQLFTFQYRPLNLLLSSLNGFTHDIRSD